MTPPTRARLALLLLAACATVPKASEPSPAEWGRLRARLTGKLEPPQPATGDLKNPFALQDRSGATQSAGWLDAWAAAPSRFVVAAENAGDVAAAVEFARTHHLRLAIKGTGHDYLGRSTAAGSLLIWTHKMRAVTVHDAFRAQACTEDQPVQPAVTVEAGTRWVEAYEAVTVKHGRYVQGGGCTSVGAAGGFAQGGGFGSWSKKYGTAAASMLEAEVVTADAKIRIANACQNPDLFWALKGGGGGTFGVVTKMTFMTHPLPSYFGWVNGTIEAKSDDAFKALIARFLAFYRERLADERWGEQIRLRGNNSMNVSLAFLGMRASQAESIWQPFKAWLESDPSRFTVSLKFDDAPATMMWNIEVLKKYAADSINADERPDADPGARFWWKDDSDQVGAYWYAYQSRWIPLDRFEPPLAEKFAATLFEASRHWSIGLHFNKGQAGADPEAVTRGRATSMNPAVFKAAALVIIAAAGDGPGPEGNDKREKVRTAMKIIRDVTPGAGSYVNETDYFEPDWQTSFWGENYPKLLEIKRKYDPDGIFSCHHCVGSDER